MEPRSPGGKRLRADARHNREALVSAARELFVERGSGVPLDEVVRAARVGNATLYRHFPTRRDLLVAVYAEETESLCAKAHERLSAADPLDGLFGWLAEFVAHVAGKTDLAMAATEGEDSDRSTLFDSWHASIHEAAQPLLERAQHRGVVTPDVATADLLTLANGIAVTSENPTQARRLLDLLRDGIARTLSSRR
ncbi:MAG: TetR/AcrR family transcriptional regulator [Stackebrandtia sp.]